MYRKVLIFFDVLEDRVRSKLSEWPILYAAIASVGVVLLWRGIWHIADSFNMSGVASVVLGAGILLITGIFVSDFIGNRVLLTGLRKEKKLAEKTRDEIEGDIAIEKELFKDISKSIHHIEAEIEKIKSSGQK